MDLREQIEHAGFAVVEEGLTADEVEVAIRQLEPLESALRAAGRGGIRDALRGYPTARDLLTHPSVRRAVEAVLGSGAFAVRGLLFDKRADANWKAPWHQDRTIAVRRRLTATGYGPWSEKAGVPHVQPPRRILESMLTVRIHLDECDPSNGPVQVLPGSHREGRLSDTVITNLAHSVEPVTCAVRLGGLLIMRPLLVHRSSAAVIPTRRRVLHLDVASCSLAEGLEWFEQWRCAA